MPRLDPHRARTVVECRHGHRHDLCVTTHRGVPPELRCSADQPAGYVTNSGGQGAVCPMICRRGWIASCGRIYRNAFVAGTY